jgi:HK97 family phage prohead protease
MYSVFFKFVEVFLLKKEIRAFQMDIEVRSEGDDKSPKIMGYAAKFDSFSENLGGFREIIRRGSFSKAVKDDDVRALMNHDANYVLGRNKSGTLKLEEDDTGLRIEVDPPNTTWAKDLMESMKRGDITQMSFGFYTNKDNWYEKDGETVRELLDVSLFDVSIVTYPAYVQTEADVRSAKQVFEEYKAANDIQASALAQEKQEAQERSIALFKKKLNLKEREV